MSASHDALMRVHEVICKLLDPETGCPWDKEQQPLSMCEYIVEESFELVDAIRSGLPGHACEEMGDVLFLLLFTAHRYAEAGQFSLADALNGVADKMIRRHPHVFSGEDFGSKEAFVQKWEAIKKQEKAEKGESRGVFGSMPRNLPPLTKAYRVHAKAAQAGFTWPEDEEVERQVEAEWLELLDAMQSGDPKAQEQELGDMIFTLAELGRRKGIKVAQAVDMAANRFINRMERMEGYARDKGQVFAELSLDDKDELWNQAKAAQRAEQG